MKLVFTSFFAIVYRWLVHSTARHSSWSGSSRFWRMLMGALCDDVSLFCQDCFQWVSLIPKTESWHSFIFTATCAVFPTYMVFTFHVLIFMALFERKSAGPTASVKLRLSPHGFICLLYEGTSSSRDEVWTCIDVSVAVRFFPGWGCWPHT